MGCTYTPVAPERERRVLLLLSILYTLPAMACPAGTADIEARTQQALRSYQNLDVDGFKDNLQTLREQVACLEEPLTPALATQVHQLYAVGAWLRQEPEASIASWRAFVAIDPDQTVGEDIAPPGSQLRELYSQAVEAGPGPQASSAVPALRVDGVDGSLYPTERASIVQRPANGTWQTRYTYGQMPAEFNLPPPSSPRSDRSPSRRLLTGAVMTGAGAGIGIGSALVLKGRYNNLPDGESGDGIRMANQITGLSGYALGASAIGLTAAAFIVGSW